MHLIALVESPDHVCCRYRLSAFADHFHVAGIDVELRTLPRSPWQRLRLGTDMIHADAVVLQRKLLPAWQIALLKRRVRCLIYDFDDALFLRDSYSTKGRQDPRRVRRFVATLRHADAIMAGNSFLFQAACRHADPERVYYAPTCVDLTSYSAPLPRHAGPSLDLVWIGSSSTLQGLEAIRPLLEQLGAQHPGLRLKVICDRFPTFACLPVVPCAWTESTEAIDLQSADVGISWLPDDDWSRGKCGLKVLQYMASGLPVIANPVGVQRELLSHGETGFLATSPQEWLSAIRCLAADAGLRRRMGDAGRRRVARDFSVETGARRWLTMLHSLLRTKRIAA